jgi:hypothetical protein
MWKSIKNFLKHTFIPEEEISKTNAKLFSKQEHKTSSNKKKAESEKIHDDVELIEEKPLQNIIKNEASPIPVIKQLKIPIDSRKTKRR